MSITAPMTPSPGGSPSRSRICKKLVLKGHASSSGASYTLFLKVQLPTSDREESFFLLSDPYLELQDAIVHRLDPHGAAPALSTSAATAANSLGIPLSIDHDMNDSLIDFDLHKSQKPSLSAKSDQSHLPSVIRCDDGRFMLRTSARTSPRSKQASASLPTSVSYMVTLNLQVPPSSKPPFAPFSVRLAVPVCLNNFMRFTVDEDIGDELGLSGITVEVDPPILPLSSQRRVSRRRSSIGSSHRAPSTASLSDDEADVTLLGSRSVDDDDGSDSGEDDSVIVGPFHACDALVVRIAAQQAGDLVSPGPSYRFLPNALRAKKASSSITFQPPVADRGNEHAKDPFELGFEAVVHLQDPFFAGLDREVQLYMQLDPAQSIVDWKPIAVDAARGILSWSFGPTASSSSSPSQLPRTASAVSLHTSPKLFRADLVVLPDSNEETTDEEDLLQTAPPKGINDADFDFSLDNAAAPTTKKRRFSLQLTSSARDLPSQSSSEPSDEESGSSRMLTVSFSLLPVLQSDEPLTITVRGSLFLSGVSAELLQDPDKMPRGLFVPTALAHEYQRRAIASHQTQSQELQPADELAESLKDSRETVQLPSDIGKQSITIHKVDPVGGDAKVDEVFRQALAIISAHNATLNAANRQQVAEPGREQSHGWIFRLSHLLWTLLLTAMMVMLFNAGQSANRDLSNKLEELARIIEASSRNQAQRFPPSLDSQSVGPGVVESMFQASSSPSPAPPETVEYQPYPVKTYGELDNPSLPSADETGAFRKDDEADPFLGEVLARSLEIRPRRPEDVAVSYFVSDWLRDLLRSPLLMLHRLLTVLLGA